MAKIGVLGGSFNPAHEGHYHISEIARKKLGLTEVWWLVSPQNPLKAESGMMDFKKRFASALKVKKRNSKIRILDIESKLGTQFTVDTLTRLHQKFPGHEFYWLMGADNLMSFDKWKGWENILKLAPVHVLDRDEYYYKAVKGRAKLTHPKRITYHKTRKNKLSATSIRRKMGKPAVN